jgi:4-hydroxybenzoate polyprenyltransferase
MVALWVAGFDVIYALQDVDVDKRDRLFSVPSRLGVPAALWISRALHIAAFASLFLAWRSEPRLNALFGAAVALVGVLLITEHAVLARRGKAGLEMAFFTVNGVVSCVLGAAGCADVLL